MNREIKFRAWEKNQGMLFFSNPFPDDEYNGLFFSCDKGDSTNAGSIKLMQFTGLRDKNGKEIWEGDLMNISGHIWSVVWSNDLSRFSLVTKNVFNTKPNAHFFKSIMYGTRNGEIIGNIYENPDLLSNPQ